MVDPNGVLRTQIYMDQTGQLMWQRMAAAKAQLNPKLAKPSPMRKISLTRLDAALREKLQAGEKPTDEMKNLAGLTRVQYVFYYPDTKDIVIAGPAEGWAADLSGRVRGLTSGKPVVAIGRFGDRPARVSAGGQKRYAGDQLLDRPDQGRLAADAGFSEANRFAPVGRHRAKPNCKKSLAA